MQRTTQIRILKELMHQLDEKKNVDAGCQVKNPTRSYVCPELAAREWELFFRRHPQVIGLSGELPEAGSFLTVDDFGVPVLATRAEDGRFRAFLNACRHRGTRLTDDCRGDAKNFMCPFHNWTYRNTGELVGIARERDFGKVDRASHGLVELPTLEAGGFLWAHPQPDGKLDVDALLGDLAPELESWNLGEFVLTDESTLEKRLNWKLANDTFGETYHFARLHKNTLSRIFYSDALSFEAFGRNHRFCFPSRGIDSLRKKPEDEWRMETGATVLYYLFPNIQITASTQQSTMFRIYPHPTDPNRSITQIRQYFAPQTLARLREHEASGGRIITGKNVYDPEARGGQSVFSPDAAREVFASTLEHEDYAMGESTQRVAEAGALEHIVFGRNEPALHHFHESFREALEMPPLDRV